MNKPLLSFYFIASIWFSGCSVIQKKTRFGRPKKRAMGGLLSMVRCGKATMALMTITLGLAYLITFIATVAVYFRLHFTQPVNVFHMAPLCYLSFRAAMWYSPTTIDNLVSS